MQTHPPSRGRHLMQYIGALVAIGVVTIALLTLAFVRGGIHRWGSAIIVVSVLANSAVILFATQKENSRSKS